MRIKFSNRIKGVKVGTQAHRKVPERQSKQGMQSIQCDYVARELCSKRLYGLSGAIVHSERPDTALCSLRVANLTTGKNISICLF
jgi:hypothetical protein